MALKGFFAGDDRLEGEGDFFGDDGRRTFFGESIPFAKATLRGDDAFPSPARSRRTIGEPAKLLPVRARDRKSVV